MNKFKSFLIAGLFVAVAVVMGMFMMGIELPLAYQATIEIDPDQALAVWP